MTRLQKRKERKKRAIDEAVRIDRVEDRSKRDRKVYAYGSVLLALLLWSPRFYTVCICLMGYSAGILWLSCCRSRLLLERSFWSRERL